MFLETIDDSEQHVVLVTDHFDGKSGTWLVFARADQVEQDAPSIPHWVGEMCSPITLQVATRWFAARRDRWQQWGAMAELIGWDQFAAYMRDLFIAEPLEEVLATTVDFSSDMQSVAIGEMLASTQTRRRTEVVYRHRFASKAAGKAFCRWLYTAQNLRQLDALVDVGYSSGGRALGALLDGFASDEMARRTPGRSGSGRRRLSKA